jgi:putative ABC transport system permease protein
VLASLQKAGIDTQLSITANEVGETSKLLSISWTFGLLRILGIVAGVLAVVGMLLYVAARRRSRLVSYLLGKRMELSVHDHRLSILIELFSMLAAALVLGGGLGLVASRLVYVGLDLLPTVPPAPLFRVPSTEVVATGVVFALAAVMGAFLIQRASDRARPGEVMRLAD